MTRQEHLLTILSEECSEVAQRVSKALRFSLNEIQPGQNLTNAERIKEEFFDLVAVMQMLHDEGAMTDWSDERITFHTQAKRIQVEKYLVLSKEKGTLI